MRLELRIVACRVPCIPCRLSASFMHGGCLSDMLPAGDVQDVQRGVTHGLGQLLSVLP